MKTRLSKELTSDNPRAGGALVMALVAVLVVSVLATSFLQLSTSLTRRQGQATATKEAFYLAEAGLAEAYTGLAQARTGNVGTEEEPAVFGDGLFWVEAEEHDGDVVELECTAMVGSGRATLGLVARREERTLSGLGVFADGAVVLGEGSFLDGYDSRLGDYAQQVAAGTNAGMGLFGSNGDVTVDGGSLGTTVDGDVVPGVEGSVATSGSTSITGATLPRPAGESLPPVELPSIPQGPAVVHSDPIPLVITAGESGFERLAIAPAAQVIVTGPATLLFGELQVDAQANLHFDTADGRIDVFVERGVELATDATITTSEDDPTRLGFQVAGDANTGGVDLFGNGPFHGSLYAPAGKVSLGDSFEVYGTVVARELELAPGARLHFDHALAESDATALLPRMLSWRIVAMPAQLAGVGYDPFKALGVKQIDLPLPSEAHEDQWLDVSYDDWGGTVRNFSGMESGFDWSDVGEVVSATRDGECVTAPEPAPVLPLDPDEQALLGILSDPNLNSSDIRLALEAASPLSSFVLEEAVAAGVMSSSDLEKVLTMNSPLPTAILVQTSSGTGNLQSSDLRDVLVASSPLPQTVLTAVVAGMTGLSTSDRQAVIDAQ